LVRVDLASNPIKYNHLELLFFSFQHFEFLLHGGLFWFVMLLMLQLKF